MLESTKASAQCVARLLFGFIVCCLIGLPSIGFPSFETLLLRRGIFNDRCQVFSQWTGVDSGMFPDRRSTPTASSAIICADQRAAFTKIFRTGSVLQALAWILVEISMKYVGSMFSTVCGSLLLAAGNITIAEATNNEDGDIFMDPYALGYSLMCAGGVFLVAVAYHSVIGSVKSPFYWGICLAAVIELSPLCISLLDQWLQYPPIDVLMRKIIWLPGCLLMATLLIMPFLSSSDVRDDKLSSSLKLWICSTTNTSPHDFYVGDSDDDVAKYPSELTPLLDTAAQRVTRILPDSSPVVKKKWRRKSLVRLIKSGTFFTLLASYTVHSLSLDSLLISLQARGQLYADTPVEQFVTEHGPIVACLMVPFILALSRSVQLTVLYCITALVCTACAFLQLTQLESSSRFWIALAVSIHSARAMLFWTNVCCVAKLFGFSSLRPVLLALTLATNILEWFLLQGVDYAFTFTGSGPFKASCLFIVVQLLTTLLTLRKFSQVARITRRRLLEVEAWLVFSGA